MFIKSSTMSHVTQFPSKKRPREETNERNKDKKQKMDHFKKMQCSVALKRLMVHRDSWPFKNTMDGNIVEWQPPMDLDTIKQKLENGLYLETNQFSEDIRTMFSHLLFHYHVSHEIHKTAVKMSELFEKKWKSLEESWVAEEAKGEEQKPKPLRNLRQGSVRVKACGSMTSKLSCEDNTCPNSLCKGSAITLSEYGMSIAKPKQHLLDNILAAQSSMLGYNVDLQLQRKRKREAARVMIRKIERTVFIDDNLKSFTELEQLCGHSLTECGETSLEKILGLTLKEEFMAVTDLEEENFLSRDWEEGEIV